MDSKTFYEINDIHESAKPNERIWTNELAIKYGYPSSEAMRSSFRRAKNVYPKKEEKKYEHKNNKTNAKILLFDIESSLINAFVWGIWEQNVNIQAIIQDWHIISWSAKYLFDNEIMSDVLTSDEAKIHDDSRICKSIWKLLDNADIVIGHNCNSFDIKRLNTRFIYNNILPPKSYQSIDTLLVAKNTFDFSSRKLDYINEYLGLPKKKDTSFDLWIGCYYGDQKCLDEMVSYNRGDCDILEDLYLRMRGYIKGHPNLNLWSEENVSICPNCGSKELSWNGYYYTYTGYYKAFRCSDCGAIGRSKQLETSKEKRKSIVR